MIEASKYVAPWRAAVTSAAIDVVAVSDWEKQSGPCEATFVFFIARPPSVKEDERPFPVKPPDLDKLVRAVCDSLTDAGVWDDDGQLIRFTASKVYVPPGEDGVHVTVSAA